MHRWGYASVSRSLLPIGRSLLPVGRSLLPVGRSLFTLMQRFSQCFEESGGGGGQAQPPFQYSQMLNFVVKGVAVFVAVVPEGSNLKKISCIGFI